MEPPATDVPYVPRARIEVCPHHHRNHPMDRYACFHRRMTELKSVNPCLPSCSFVPFVVSSISGVGAFPIQLALHQLRQAFEDFAVLLG